MKSNKCAYYNEDALGSRRHFCSEVCNSKYWAGVYSKKWKRGDFPVMKGDSPTEEELSQSKKKHKARVLAYKKYKKGMICKCDICGIKTKNINRHHEDYDQPEICIIVCRKCHGFIERYNNLKKYLYNEKGGKTK